MLANITPGEPASYDGLADLRQPCALDAELLGTLRPTERSERRAREFLRRAKQGARGTCRSWRVDDRLC